MWNSLETNSTDNSKTNIFDRWDRDANRSDHSSLFSSRTEKSNQLFTAATAIISFVMIVISLETPISMYVITGGILGKLYSTTMMVVLNNRIVIKTQDEESVMFDVHLSSSVSRWLTFGAPPWNSNAEFYTNDWTIHLGPLLRMMMFFVGWRSSGLTQLSLFFEYLLTRNLDHRTTSRSFLYHVSFNFYLT